MQIAEFKGFCPYEIGDKVILQTFGYIKTIRDIRTIHYLKSGKTEFEFQMEEHQSDWVPQNMIYKRVE